METLSEIRDWVLAEINDTSSVMQVRVTRYIHTILTPAYLGVKYNWNLNVSTLSIASGASSFALPSSMGELGTLWNTTYDTPLTPMSKRQILMRDTEDGIVRRYQRIGANITFLPAFGTQSIYMEWYPLFATLASGGAIPLCPDKQTIADGAAWLWFEDQAKQERAARYRQQYEIGKSKLQDGSNDELVSIEDSSVSTQEGI